MGQRVNHSHKRTMHIRSERGSHQTGGRQGGKGGIKRTRRRQARTLNHLNRLPSHAGCDHATDRRLACLTAWLRTASTEFKQKERGEANPKQGQASRPPQGRRRPGRCTSLPHSSKDRRWKRLSASQGDICHGLGDTDEEKEAQSEPRGGKRGGTHAWTHARHGQLEEGGGRRARGYILGSSSNMHMQVCC